jgi:hypothetical protein
MHYFKSFFSAILAVLFISSNQIFAQQPPAISWQNCFGGKNGEQAQSIIKANGNADGYVIAGWASSYDGDVLNNHTSFVWIEDAWILNVDSGGILWQTCLGGSGDDGAYSIIPTRDGGYAVCGLTQSSDGDFYGYHDSSDAWVAKLSSKGQIEWAYCYGGNHYDMAISIVETDEGFTFFGYTNSPVGDVPYKKNKDAWVVSLNAEGNILWQRRYGGSGEEDQENVSSFIKTKDGGFAFATLTTSNDGDVKGNHLDSAGHTSGDFWVVKLDHLGEIEWQRCYGGSSWETPLSIIQSSDNGYAVAGVTASTDGDVKGLRKNDISDLHNGNEWIIKIDSAGNLQWQKCLGGSNNHGNGDIARSIIQTSNGDYIIAGNAGSNNGDVSGNHWFQGTESLDAWLVKLDATGRFIKWQKCYGGVEVEYVNSIIQTSKGGYIFAGNTFSYDGDVSGIHSQHADLWVVKLDPDTVAVSGVSNNNFTNENIKVFPNPSSTEVHFSLEANFTNPSFYDIMGRQYFPSYSIEGNTIICNVSDLVSGIYMLRLNSVSVPFIVQH